MTISPSVHFPDKYVLGRALFEEGIRHLEDARVLYEAQRYAASFASALKAAELGIKTVIVLDGALGWWGKTFTTHTPLTDIKALPYFKRHVASLENYRNTFIREVVEMEKLAPSRPSAEAFDVKLEQNPEYPFLSHSINSTTQASEFQLNVPSLYFTEEDSRKYYNTAQDLLKAITTQYLDVDQWGLTLPQRL